MPRKQLGASSSYLGRSFLMRNKHSGMYMEEANYDDGNIVIEQRKLPEPHVRDSFIWYIILVEINHHIIVNRRSGKAIGLTRKPGIALASELLSLFDVTATEEVSIIWQLELLYEGPDSPCMIVTDLSARLHLSIQSNSLKTDAALVQEYNDLKMGPYLSGHRWIFEIYHEFSDIVAAEENVCRNVIDVSLINRITSDFKTSDLKTKPVLMAKMVLPFPAITDPNRTTQQQSVQSPFYVLTRIGYWHKLYHFDHSGAIKVNTFMNTKVGLITDNSNEVKKITGLTVRLKKEKGQPLSHLTFGYRSRLYTWFGYDVAKRLNIEVDSESDDPEFEMEDFVIDSYEANGIRVAESIWFKENTFVLTDMVGQELIQWTIREPTDRLLDGTNPIIDRHPPSSSSDLPELLEL